MSPGRFLCHSDRDWVLDGAIGPYKHGWLYQQGGGGRARTRWRDRAASQFGPNIPLRCNETAPAKVPAWASALWVPPRLATSTSSLLRRETCLMHQIPMAARTATFLRPFRNGSDLVRRASDRWIIDYGTDRPMPEAALYESPFQYVIQHVKPLREKNNRKRREALVASWVKRSRHSGRRFRAHRRYLATARVARHRLFVWLDTVVLPDSKVIAIALIRRYEPWSASVACSRGLDAGELWYGMVSATTQPTTRRCCFETFPFPNALPKQSTRSPPQRRSWTPAQRLAEPSGVDQDGSAGVSRLGGRPVGAVRGRAGRPRHRHRPLAARPCPRIPNAPRALASGP